MGGSRLYLPPEGAMKSAVEIPPAHMDRMHLPIPQTRRIQRIMDRAIEVKRIADIEAGFDIVDDPLMSVALLPGSARILFIGENPANLDRWQARSGLPHKLGRIPSFRHACRRDAGRRGLADRPVKCRQKDARGGSPRASLGCFAECAIFKACRKYPGRRSVHAG